MKEKGTALKSYTQLLIVGNRRGLGVLLLTPPPQYTHFWTFLNFEFEYFILFFNIYIYI